MGKRETITTKTGTIIRIPTLPNFVSITGLNGKHLTEPMQVSVKVLTEDDCRAIGKAYTDLLIEKRNK